MSLLLSQNRIEGQFLRALQSRPIRSRPIVAAASGLMPLNNCLAPAEVLASFNYIEFLDIILAIYWPYGILGRITLPRAFELDRIDVLWGSLLRVLCYEEEPLVVSEFLRSLVHRGKS